MDQIYKMFVRPHLDYCDVIYHTPATLNDFNRSTSLTSLMESLGIVQYQAVLAVSGCWQGTSRNKIFEELGWETLSDRRWARRMIFFYKIFHRISPFLPPMHISLP